MKNSNTRSGNIFESIKKEEEKEDKAKKVKVDTKINKQEQVKPAIKTEDLVAENTDTSKTAEQAKNLESAKIVSDNSGNNYSNKPSEQVEEPVNNGLLYITPTRKKTRSHRKGFLLSDLALENLQKEAQKYEISENELINQILEKMI